MKQNRKTLCVTMTEKQYEELTNRAEHLSLSKSQLSRMLMDEGLREQKTHPYEIALVVQLRDTISKLAQSHDACGLIDMLEAQINGLIRLKGETKK